MSSKPWEDFVLPCDIRKHHNINIFDWRHLYYSRETEEENKRFNEIWNDMEKCINALQRHMVKYPMQSKVILDILLSEFPDLFTKIVLKDKNKKEKEQLLSNKIESDIKI